MYKNPHETIPYNQGLYFSVSVYLSSENPYGKQNKVEGIFDGVQYTCAFREEIDYQIFTVALECNDTSRTLSIQDYSACATLLLKDHPEWVPQGEKLYTHQYLAYRDKNGDYSPQVNQFESGIVLQIQDEYRYVSGKNTSKEEFIQTLKYISLFEVYYAKIERFYTSFRKEIYPKISKTQTELIRTCTEILDISRNTWTQNDTKILSGWSFAIDELNFALQFDCESIRSNISNMENKIKILGGDQNPYLNHQLEKAQFILHTFERAKDKNLLIKETLLQNGIQFIQARREESKLQNEFLRTAHIKNLKELLGGFAIIEIIANGLAQAAKIAEISGKLGGVLQSVELLRFLLLGIFVGFYFIWYFFFHKKSLYA